MEGTPTRGAWTAPSRDKNPEAMKESALIERLRSIMPGKVNIFGPYEIWMLSNTDLDLSLPRVVEWLRGRFIQIEGESVFQKSTGMGKPRVNDIDLGSCTLMQLQGAPFRLNLYVIGEVDKPKTKKCTSCEGRPFREHEPLRDGFGMATNRYLGVCKACYGKKLIDGKPHEVFLNRRSGVWEARACDVRKLRAQNSYTYHF